MTTSAPTFPGVCPPTVVQRGNAWAQPITLPSEDGRGNPLSWGAFTVTSSQTDLLTVTVDGLDVVVALTEADTAAIASRYVHWYLAEDTVMAGNEFLTGRIELRARQ